MARPVVAIVGRPNVGKSTLFNKLIGKRLSIVDNTPGVTRDRIYGNCEWLGHNMLLVDTGGIEPFSDDVILSQMRRQAELAITSADVIIFVTDIRSGVVAADSEVASMLQKSGKPIILCVNKVDNIGALPPEFYEFYNLGLGDPIAVSSVHGHGTGDLLDEVIKNIPEGSFDDTDEDIVKVAVIGKPNVGKSSLINAIVPELALETGGLSRKTDGGRHPTRHAQLWHVCGGAVLDTPGFSLLEADEMEPKELCECYREMRGKRIGCRFGECLHRSEPDCAVKPLIGTALSPERYERYLIILDELIEKRKHKYD